MRASVILATVARYKQGPAILLECESPAEMFALQTIINNGLRLHNHGGNSQHLTALIGYSEKSEPITNDNDPASTSE